MNRTAKEIIAEWRASNLNNDDGELASSVREFEAFWDKFRPNDPFMPEGPKTYAWLGWQARERAGEAAVQPTYRDPNTGIESVLSTSTGRDILKRMADEIVADRRKYLREAGDDADYWQGYDSAIKHFDSEMRNWRIKNYPNRVEAATTQEPTELELDSILKRRPNGGLE